MLPAFLGLFVKQITENGLKSEPKLTRSILPILVSGFKRILIIHTVTRCHRCKFSTVLKTLHKGVTVSLLMVFVPPKFWRIKMPMHLRSLRVIVRGFPMRAVPVFPSTLGDQ